MLKEIVKLSIEGNRIYLREQGEITLAYLKHTENDYLMFKDDFGATYKLREKDIKEYMVCEGVLTITINDK